MTTFLAGWLGLVMERYSETFTAAQLGAKKAKNVIHLAFAWPAAGTHIEKEIRNCKKDIRADVSNKGASALATKKASYYTEAAARMDVHHMVMTGTVSGQP